MLVLAALLGVAGCGGSDDEDGAPAAAGDSPAATTGTAAAGGNAAPSSDPVVGGSGPALSGDRVEASRGAAVVDDAYGDLRVAAKSGVASNDELIRNTLKAAEANDSLTRVCDMLSEAAKRQTIAYMRVSAGLADERWTCNKAMGLLLRRSGEKGDLAHSVEAAIVGVNARGDHATATVRIGGKNGRLTTVALVKEKGAWKLAAAPGG